MYFGGRLDIVWAFLYCEGSDSVQLESPTIIIVESFLKSINDVGESMYSQVTSLFFKKSYLVLFSAKCSYMPCIPSLHTANVLSLFLLVIG